MVTAVKASLKRPPLKDATLLGDESGYSSLTELYCVSTIMLYRAVPMETLGKRP